MSTTKEYTKTPDFLLRPFELAKSVYNNSHSPYSNYKVSAVVKSVGSDKLFSGVNVENASFGGTICAERSAITDMVTKMGKVKIEYILIMTADAADACLICQQFMSEFGGGEPIPLYLSNENHVIKSINSHVGFHLT